MLQKEDMPMVTSYGYIEGQKITFIFPGREIEVDVGEDLDLVLDLLKECSGYKTLERILYSIENKYEASREEVLKLVGILHNNRVILDVNELYIYYHQLISENPPVFFTSLSSKQLMNMFSRESPLFPKQENIDGYLIKLLEERRSTREFSNESLKREELEKIVWATYGRQDRSVEFPESSIGLGTIPSGGALYPLKIFIVVLSGNKTLPRGIYSVDCHGLDFMSEVKTGDIVFSFDGSLDIILPCSAVLVVACDFTLTTQKYSNRGYRYALIEAGHAAQNTYIYCTDSNVAVVEVCGFNDEVLAKVLNLNYPTEAVVTTLALGRKK